jgi:DNA-binding LacI/PurR family transcriptional regulator
MNGGAPSIRDVAERAGVSVASVSYVVNGVRRVGPDVRARVLAAVEELGYHHNASARALRTGKTLVIGHLLSHLGSNPFYARMAHAVERRAAEVGYVVLLTAGEGPSLSRRRMAALIARGVDGLIVTTAPDAETLQLAQRARVPTVVIERSASVDGVGFVGIDQQDGMRAITDALLDAGHRSLAFLGMQPREGAWADADRERLAGFQEALATRGLAPQAVRLIGWPAQDQWLPPEAHPAARDLLDREGRPSAIVAGSDLVALAVLQVAYDLRLRVPHDLSVVGWDDTLAAGAVPPLTTVAVPFEEVGQAAVDLLTGMIVGERAPEALRVPASVTWRESVAPPPGLSEGRGRFEGDTSHWERFPTNGPRGPDGGG